MTAIKSRQGVENANAEFWTHDTPEILRFRWGLISAPLKLIPDLYIYLGNFYKLLKQMLRTRAIKLLHFTDNN